MSLHRFYLPPEQWAHDLWLEGQEAKHLVQVLRLAPGEEVLLLDGQGRSGRFAIAETAKKKARLVLQEEQMAPAPESRAVMALAFSKAVRRGFFMEKAVELGLLDGYCLGDLTARQAQTWLNEAAEQNRRWGQP